MCTNPKLSNVANKGFMKPYLGEYTVTPQSILPEDKETARRAREKNSEDSKPRFFLSSNQSLPPDPIVWASSAIKSG